MCENTFFRDIFKNKTNLKEADEDQSSLLVKFMDFTGFCTGKSR